MRSFLFVMILIFSIFSKSTSAELKLPALIGSHMVLQQNSNIKVWGWAKKNDEVTIYNSWSDSTILVNTNEKGEWLTRLNTPKAGGPYKIIIKADTTIILKDVMIGEVWICSGQSNMWRPVKGFRSEPVIGSIDYITHGKNNNIRLFTVKLNPSTNPLDDCIGTWSVASPVEVSNFSATGYFFGNYIQSILNIPVGLIHSSYGGSTLEAWTDEKTIHKIFNNSEFKLLTKDSLSNKSPVVLFNGMIHPLLNYGIRGVIWYQGEANVKYPKQYSKLFPAMIESWRDHWDQSKFPFYFVQIAPYKYNSTVKSALLREAQLKTMQSVSNTGLAVTIDIGDCENIHPSEKITVGKRLAYWALARIYNMDGIPYCGPVFKNMTIEKNNAKLSFDYVDIGLTSFGKPLEGFIAAGIDRKFYSAQAIIKGKDLIVSSDLVDTIVAVRYCWDNCTEGTLFNTEGLPASSFRTDDWEE